MAEDQWLPKGFELADQSKIQSLLYSGEKWQIYNTTGSNNIMLASLELVQEWSKFGFLDGSLFADVTLGARSFRSLASHSKYIMAPVDSGKSPENKVDALAFAAALRESRKLSESVSFHDAVYVEQYTRLLPAWTLSPHVEDEVVLGTWMTGGVVISTESFRRLASLTGWMPAQDLAEIISAAGFPVSAESGLIARPKPVYQSKPDVLSAGSRETLDSDKPRSSEVSVAPKEFKLPGRPQLETFFNEHVIDIIFNLGKYKALGIEFPSAVVLHGPPGCGKTFAVERLVDFIDWPSYSIDSSSVGSPYIHETSKKISEVFDKAIDGAPSIIIIDEMESFLTDRRSSTSSGLYHVEEVAEFLRRIPEAIENRVLIIAMTNMIDMIDPAILRRGRFDHIVEVGMPSRQEVASLVDSLLNKLPKADDLHIDRILDVLTGKALSDSAFVIREAARLAAKAGKKELDQKSLEEALNSLPNTKEKKSRRIGFSFDGEQ